MGGAARRAGARVSGGGRAGAGGRGEGKGRGFNDTVRPFLRPPRGIRNRDAPLIKRFTVCYNLIRPHLALKDRTPAGTPGIPTNGAGEWDTPVANGAWASS